MDPNKPREEWSTLPASEFSGSGLIGDLLRENALDPPRRPGALAALDAYDVLGVIGSGGMGVVLRARDPASGKDIAVKILKPELTRNRNAVRHFLKEVGHMERMKHPGIVPVLHVSTDARRPYFVMPLMERGSLATVAGPERLLSKASVLAAGRTVAGALDYAHRKGIIHRDLKPGNVLIDHRGRSYLSDFGLSRSVYNDSVLDDAVSRRVGTVPYMSPAVARGEAEDTRCDIYSFGAMLYELLTGRAPYSGQSGEQILEAVRTGPPLPIRSVNPKAPDDLVTVAEGAMARELRDRYAQMADVLADLDRIKAGQKPVGPRQSRPLGRRVAAAAIGVLVILALVLGFGWIFSARQGNGPAGGPSGSDSVFKAPPVAGDVADALEVAYTAKLHGSDPAASVQILVQPGARADAPWIPLGNGDAMSSADNYRLLFMSEEPAYFYVFQVDSRGKLDWLFPKNDEVLYSSGANPVKPNQWVRLPEGEYGFQLDDTVGIEHIYVVATSKPWEPLEGALAKASSGGGVNEKIESAFSLRTRGVAQVRKTAPELPPEMEASRSEVQKLIRGEDGVLVVERWFRHVPAASGQ